MGWSIKPSVWDHVYLSWSIASWSSWYPLVEQRKHHCSSLQTASRKCHEGQRWVGKKRCTHLQNISLLKKIKINCISGICVWDGGSSLACTLSMRRESWLTLYIAAGWFGLSAVASPLERRRVRLTLRHVDWQTFTGGRASFLIPRVSVCGPRSKARLGSDLKADYHFHPLLKSLKLYATGSSVLEPDSQRKLP